MADGRATPYRAACPYDCEFCGVMHVPLYKAADLGNGKLRPLRSETGTCLSCTWRAIDMKASMERLP
jgi:hypothetical protein